MFNKFSFIILLLVSLIACSNDRSVELIDTKGYQDGDRVGFTEAELRVTQGKLSDIWDDVELKHSIRWLMMWTREGYLEIQIRKYGEFEKPMSEKEINSIRKTLFNSIGQEFPLKAYMFECCKQQANIEGEITKINDVENNLSYAVCCEKNLMASLGFKKRTLYLINRDGD